MRELRGRRPWWGFVIGVLLIAVAPGGSSASDLLGPSSGAAVTVASLPEPLRNVNRYNGSPHAQDNVWTDGSNQYVVYVDSDRNPVIAHRQTEDADFVATFDLAQIEGNPLDAPTKDDNHNLYSVATDSLGYIHVTGNMHGGSGTSGPLRYVRSVRPHDITEWEAPPMVGTDEKWVAYPQFVERADGVLLLFYRSGMAGRGNEVLNRYDAGARKWYRVGRIMNGRDTMSPYLHHVAVDRSGGPTHGVIHIAWEWRDSGGGGEGEQRNHDLSYARSTDGGLTWTRSDGSSYSIPIYFSAAERIDALPVGSGLTNAGGLEVDSNGRPHVVYERGDATGTVRPYHAWHDGTSWNISAIDGVAPLGENRLPVVTTNDGQTFVLFQSSGGRAGARVMTKELTPGVDAAPFTVLDFPIGDAAITFDTRSLYEREQLTMLVTASSDGSAVESTNWDDQWGGVVTVDLARIDKLQRAEIPTVGLTTVISDTAPAGDVAVADGAAEVDVLEMPISSSDGSSPSFVRLTPARLPDGLGVLDVRLLLRDGGVTRELAWTRVDTDEAVDASPWVRLPEGTSGGVLVVTAQASGGDAVLDAARVDVAILTP